MRSSILLIPFALLFASGAPALDTTDTRLVSEGMVIGGHWVETP